MKSSDGEKLSTAQVEASIKSGPLDSIIEAYKCVSNVKATIYSTDEKVFFNKLIYGATPAILELSVHERGKKEEIIKKLENFFSKKPISVRYGDYANPHNYIYNRQTKELFFDDYLQTSEGTTDYIGNTPLTSDFLPELNIEVPQKIASICKSPSLWLGQKGCITPLHLDTLDNFVYHLKGRKKWILIPPCYMQSLGAFRSFPDKFPNLYCSLIDLRNAEEVTKLKSECEALEIVVRDGQLLFLPAGWGHYVETISFSININLWVDPNKAVPFVFSSAPSSI